MTGDAVGAHYADGEHDENGIDAHRTGKQEIECHKEGEERGGSGTEPDDKPEPYQNLTDNDGI